MDHPVPTSLISFIPLPTSGTQDGGRHDAHYLDAVGKVKWRKGVDEENRRIAKREGDTPQGSESSGSLKD